MKLRQPDDDDWRVFSALTLFMVLMNKNLLPIIFGMWVMFAFVHVWTTKRIKT